MVVDVDEARRDDEAAGVDHTRGLFPHAAQRDDAAGADREIAGKGRVARAIDDAAAADEEVDAGRLVCVWGGEQCRHHDEDTQARPHAHPVTFRFPRAASAGSSQRSTGRRTPRRLPGTTLRPVPADSYAA